MSEDGSVTRWIGELKAGDDQDAANFLWHRFHKRLLWLARKQLGGTSRRVTDEEDVVAEALAALLRGVQDDRFPKLHDRKSLWSLLTSITEHKAIDQMRRNGTEGRGGGNVAGESGFGDRGIGGVVDNEPTPEFAAQWSEEFSRLLARLDDEGDKTLRPIAIANLEGFTKNEISERLVISLRSVERKLRLVRQIWEEALDSTGKE